MALLSTLMTSTLASSATMPPSTNAQPSNIPTLYVPDTKARNAVIFGTMATVLTIVTIIIALAGLRIAYQTRLADHQQRSNNADTEDPDVEMVSIDDTRTVSQASNADSAVERDEP